MFTSFKSSNVAKELKYRFVFENWSIYFIPVNGNARTEKANPPPRDLIIGSQDRTVTVLVLVNRATRSVLTGICLCNGWCMVNLLAAIEAPTSTSNTRMPHIFHAMSKAGHGAT
jgi:hypothetical protein